MLRFKMPHITIFMVCLLCSNIATARDFSLELIKCRAHLDMVIGKSGSKYQEIKTQADAIGETIKKLRQEMVDKEIEDKGDVRWEVAFRRKIVCLDISIKALGIEMDKHLLRDILIRGIV